MYTYSAGGNPEPVSIRNIYWTENSSQPIKDSLFLGYVIEYHDHKIQIHGDSMLYLINNISDIFVLQ